MTKRCFIEIERALSAISQDKTGPDYFNTGARRATVKSFLGVYHFNYIMNIIINYN